jgi:adenylylsulfate kinase-like enzyme
VAEPVSGEVVPILWMCGPPGVGKTTVGWEIYTQLIRSRIAVGYVDIDQLGICYPEPASDPGRHRMKARNLGAVVGSFRAAGARCVVVSGVIDAVRGVPIELIGRAAVTLCRLRADHDVIRQRLLTRRVPVEQVDQVLRNADDLDAGAVADVCVDTTGLSVPEVARQVRQRTGGWPVLTRPSRPTAAVAPAEYVASMADGPILWLCGATGVGKSTVGFAVYQKALRAGLTAAYIDLDQIGFCSTAPAAHRVRARIVAAMWQTYRAAGARTLVMVGPVEDQAAVAAYADALPAATVTLCRLHAGRTKLTTRIMLRGQGVGWPQPGDPLNGQPIPHLRRIADHAVTQAEALDRAALGLRIDTDNRTIDDTVDLIVARIGWRNQAEQPADGHPPSRSG